MQNWIYFCHKLKLFAIIHNKNTHRMLALTKFSTWRIELILLSDLRVKKIWVFFKERQFSDNGYARAYSTSPPPKKKLLPDRIISSNFNTCRERRLGSFQPKPTSQCDFFPASNEAVAKYVDLKNLPSDLENANLVRRLQFLRQGTIILHRNLTNLLTNHFNIIRIVHRVC